MSYTAASRLIKMSSMEYFTGFFITSLTFTLQDGVLCISADISIKERALLLQSTGEASPWKQAKCGHTVRGRRC